MNYHEFVTNDCFRRLAATIRPAYCPRWQNEHPQCGVQFLLAQARDVATEEAFSKGVSRNLFTTRICRLATEMSRADESLGCATDVLDWFISQMSTESAGECAAMASLLLAYASASISGDGEIL